jgi:hypothetical protein
VSEYTRYQEDVLVAFYRHYQIDSPAAFLACEALEGLNLRQDDWLWNAIDGLNNAGFIGSPPQMGVAAGGRTIMMKSPGLTEAERIIEQRRPRSWVEAIASISRSDWISIAALLVSAFALWKS